jgi:hypothetical protein
MRILSPRLGCQVGARDLPLEGIVAGRTGRGPISIHMGRDPKNHVEHEVVKPIQVWVELADDGAEEALDIESEDGTKTLVIFGPETVDDVLRRFCERRPRGSLRSEQQEEHRRKRTTAASASPEPGCRRFVEGRFRVCGRVCKTRVSTCFSERTRRGRRPDGKRS